MDEKTSVSLTRKNMQDLFALFIGILCTVVFTTSLLNYLHISLDENLCTLLFELMAFVFLLVYMRRSHATIMDYGVRLTNAKKTFAESLAISAVIVGPGALAKVVLLQVRPEMLPPDAPFFRLWSRSVMGYLYILTAIVQEFLARGVVQTNLNAIFAQDKHRRLKVVVLSALVFGVFHIHCGFLFMLAASTLVAVLGVLYDRHGNIWGTVTVHFLVGYCMIHMYIF